MTGMVFLVGAGCADPGLLTVRGRDCLAAADAVVYDDLLADGLLSAARPDARLLYVGKRSGKHSMPQPEINALLVSLAREGLDVCRLKGGDPLVFGRGGEEALALQEAGIPYELVPGVSSCIAAPELAGIPVTHRGLSRSFHVMTAHTADTPDGLPGDFDRMAALDGTLVFLMGLRQLPRIAERLIAAGKPPATPAALVGRTALRGTLADLPEKAAGFPGPAVIVVGPAAALDLSSRSPRPLDGLRVGLTGTAHFQRRIGALLRRLGAGTVCVQANRVEPACEPAELCRALDEGFDWVALSSPNGVRQFFSLLRAGRYDLRRLLGVKFAVIGPGTAQALEEQGFFCDLMPAVYDTVSLGAALAERCGGARVLLASAENASDAPRRLLEQSGIACRRLSLYRLAAGGREDAGIDWLVFGSAGGVDNYCRAGGSLAGKTACCIGAVTARRARELGAARIVQAGAATAESLAGAMVQAQRELCPQ